MKILQISSLYPPHIGGIENHVKYLSESLVEDGHDVTVYTSNIPTTKYFDEINGVKIYRFKSVWSPLNNQISPGIFLKLISNKGFDIIHVHSHLHFTSNMAAISNIFAKRPLLLTSHGTVTYKGYPELINKLYNKSIAKIMLRSARKIIALTPTQAEILIELGANPEDICIIPNGINLRKIRRIDNSYDLKKLYNIGSKQVILYVGALIPRKGLTNLIDAMAQIKSDAILLVVGGMNQGSIGFKSELEIRIKNNKLNNIIFLGRLSDLEITNIYNLADLFVLPSFAEGLPITLLEAMAYNKCILASNIAGINDIIENGKNGILFNPIDSLDLAKKIDFLLSNDSLRHKMGYVARREIEEYYNWDKVFLKILETYKNLLFDQYDKCSIH